MGKLITMAGNSGVGKTTLAKLLSEAGGFELLAEDNVGRPFQKRFDEDLKRYALPNQVDFLLFRAEQEIFAR
ncbi:MAG: deoxynucleoside kinase [Anaerolineae bacterium]|nr:deoxynucleoside kinase [Anaerolineae bacterium]